ncbi:MAG: ferrous iron transport protein B, partial [Oscillospiraceae bacterium]
MKTNRKIIAALAGNPNCGKTTLFNQLTGSNQYVGNWSGVTVEKKSGMVKNSSVDFELVDLPGIYSLYPYSMEEIVSRDFIIKQSPNLILNIVDGTNIERNLYLSLQLMELSVPMVIAVNMIDDVQAKGGEIYCEKLSKILNVPVVPISAKKGTNLNLLIETCLETADTNYNNIIKYDNNTQFALDSIKNYLKDKKQNEIPIDYAASKLLEGSKSIKKSLTLDSNDYEIINSIIKNYEKTSQYGDKETMVADARYKFIENATKISVLKPEHNDKENISDKIDKVLTNKYLAIPIFVLIMYLMFSLTFGWPGTALSDAIEYFFSDIISPFIENLLQTASAPGWTEALLVDAVIGGVGGILVFLPQISILFLCLSLLEDSGYMARAAFITDRLLSKLGLSGKSFIPMLMGFGCTTPAVMAART